MEKIPTWTCVVALALGDGEGRWLMHQRPADKQHGGLWEFPGGKVESDESPAEALVREIGEELGLALDIAALAPAGFAQEPVGSRAAPIVILLYTCGDWSGAPEALEGGAIAWFTWREMAVLPRPPLDIALCQSLAGQTRS